MHSRPPAPSVAVVEEDRGRKEKNPGPTFDLRTPDSRDGCDAAYHAKYDRYGPEIVGIVVGRKAEEVTIRLMPRS